MIDSLRRRKTEEPRDKLAYIGRSMASLIRMDFLNGIGLTGRFPASAPRTPSDPPTAGRYESTAQTWRHPTWQALDFILEDPHFYSYEVITNAAGYTARAYGDLDGDGVQSTFEIQGSLLRPFEVVSGPVTFTNELE
jgi:hypothetical protein